MLGARRLALALILLGAALPAAAQDTEAERAAEFWAEVDPFQLFSACAPLRPIVYNALRLADDEFANLVRQMVETRLRAARIYSDRADAVFGSTPQLRVTIRVWDGAVPFLGTGVFSVRVEFRKPVRDAFGTDGYAVTWEQDWIDTVTRDRPAQDHVLPAASELIDRFVAAYLRANAAAC